MPSFAIAGLPAEEQSVIWRGPLCVHSTQCCRGRRGIRSLTGDEQRLLSPHAKYVEPIAAHSFSAPDQVYVREYLCSSAFSLGGKSPQASRPRMNMTRIEKPFMKPTKSGRQV